METQQAKLRSSVAEGTHKLWIINVESVSTWDRFSLQLKIESITIHRIEVRPYMVINYFYLEEMMKGCNFNYASYRLI